MWLFESWEKPDFDQWADGSRLRPMPDAVCFGHQEYRPDDVFRLLDANPFLQFFDYFNPWTQPEQEWINQRNLWFDHMNSLLSRYGLLWFDTQTRLAGITPPPDQDVLVRLDDRTKASSPSQLVEVMVGSRPAQISNHPRRRYYIDQFFPDGIEDWMANSYGGYFSVARLSPVEMRVHCECLRVLVRELSSVAPVLTGGSGFHTDPGFGLAARYYEGVGTFQSNPWDRVLPAWKSHPGNVLSVLAESPENVDRALVEWGSWGGWLAFTTQREGGEGQVLVDAAYGRAYQQRELQRPLHITIQAWNEPQ